MAHDLTHPLIRNIGVADLKAALLKGLQDFKEKPSHLVFLGVLYPIVTFAAAFTAAKSELLPLVFPLVSGFALIGPLVAIGLYELSRRREQGLDNVLESCLPGHLVTLHRRYHGTKHSAVRDLPRLARSGVGHLLDDLRHRNAKIGHGLCPTGIHDTCRLDTDYCRMWRRFYLRRYRAGHSRRVFSDAHRPTCQCKDSNTNFRACFSNQPGTMLVWGLIVAILLIFGALPLFAGLAVVMPVLGHATWHLYRRVVEN